MLSVVTIVMCSRCAPFLISCVANSGPKSKTPPSAGFIGCKMGTKSQFNSIDEAVTTGPSPTAVIGHVATGVISMADDG